MDIMWCYQEDNEGGHIENNQGRDTLKRMMPSMSTSKKGMNLRFTGHSKIKNYEICLSDEETKELFDFLCKDMYGKLTREYTQRMPRGEHHESDTL